MDDQNKPAVSDQIEQLKAQLSDSEKRLIEKAMGPAAPTPEHIMQFFAHAHLPPALAAVSKPFGDLAEQIVASLPRNPERTVALRKLLEAKDAAVRAFIAKP